MVAHLIEFATSHYLLVGIFVVLLVLLIVGCIGFLGAKRGLFGLLRGGARFHDGRPGHRGK